MNRKTRDPASRAERMAGIMKKLEDGVKDLFTSEKYQTYLATMKRLFVPDGNPSHIRSNSTPTHPKAKLRKAKWMIS